MDDAFAKPRLRSLLDHFSRVEDDRVQWRVAHPLPEVLLLVVCATIASCDDFDDIADWGEAHIGFLRRFLPYHHGVPTARWLNILLNRVDPALFSACFMSWAKEVRPDAPDLIALDGKTSRRSRDRPAGRLPLHLVSAFATRERLVLGQEAVAETSNETTAIPVLLARLAETGALDGALVTIDAVACTPKIAAEITATGADYLLAVKSNQPGLRTEIEAFFDDPETARLDAHVERDKGHGRIEERRVATCADPDWLRSDRAAPGEPRFPGLAMVAMVESAVETGGATRRERRYYIASRAMSAQKLGEAVRAHWRIENALHWVLDVAFKEDLSRVRKGHGAKNMAVVRHFAINIVRGAKDRRSIKTRRKRAGWDTRYLETLLNASAC